MSAYIVLKVSCNTWLHAAAGLTSLSAHCCASDTSQLDDRLELVEACDSGRLPVCFPNWQDTCSEVMLLLCSNSLAGLDSEEWQV